jgi:hypothetical protein
MCVCLGLSLNNHSNCEEGPGEWLQELKLAGGGRGRRGRGGRQESIEVSERGRGGFGRVGGGGGSRRKYDGVEISD